MIKKFCDWIDKESPVFLEWLDYGFDDVVFLSAHAKRVGIRKKTAWEASRKFLKCRNPKVNEKQLRERFECHYEFESTEENEREWRQIYFKGKKVREDAILLIYRPGTNEMHKNRLLTPCRPY